MDVIGSIAFLPIAVATRAIQARDHLLFQEFVPFSTFVYHLASSKAADSDVRKFMTERSWRPLRDLVNLYLLPPYMERAEGDRDLDDLQDFALFIFKIFQELMKASFDKNDISAFQVILMEFGRLFERFSTETTYPNSQMMKLHLQLLNDDEAGRTRLQAKLERQLKKEEVSRRIALAREQVLFGLAAHIFDKLFQAPADADRRQFFTEIEAALPHDLEHFTDVFVSTEDHSVSSYWGWSFWDSVADGKAHFVDVHSKPNRLYCVRALRLLSLLQPEAIERVNLKNLGYLANEGNSQGLPAMLQQIRSESERWQGILSPVELGQIDSLLELLEKARSADAVAEREAVIAAEIDSGKIAEFKANLLEAFQTSGRLRPLMQRLDAFQDLSQGAPTTRILSYGFNQLEDKGAFIVQSRISYSAWGESYGRGLSQAEDEIAFDKMTKNAATHDAVQRREFISKIEQHLIASKAKNPVVIQSFRSALEFGGINGADAFIPSYRKDCPGTSLNDLNGFVGVLKLGGQSVPVFDLLVRREDLKDKVLLIDLPRYVRWKQLPPIDAANEEEYRLGFLMVRVVDLNKDNERRQKIINEGPDWLREQSDPEKYLRSRVVVNVFEKFKIEIVDREAGICIAVDDDNS
jgi:hypothetical protein